MKQTVEILRLLDGGRCEIYVKRESSCGETCMSCGGCGTGGAAIASALNRAGALPGDIAEAEARRRDILGITALLYMLPVLLAVGLALVFEFVLSWNAALGFLAGLLFGALLIIAFGRTDRRELLIITRVLKSKHTEN